MSLDDESESRTSIDSTVSVKPAKPENDYKRSPSYELTKSQRYYLKESFEIFDKKCTGFIGAEHISVAFRALGIEPRKEEIDMLVADHDKKNTGRITFPDYLKIMRIAMGGKESTQNITKSFRLFDAEKKGYIIFEDIRRICDYLGEDCTDEEIQEMLDEADANEDGVVDETEFYHFLKDMSLLGLE